MARFGCPVENQVYNHSVPHNNVVCASYVILDVWTGREIYNRLFMQMHKQSVVC